MDQKTHPLESKIEQILEELIISQENRVLEYARRLNTRLTKDDLLQPHDIYELQKNPSWNYEDGFLAGLRCAQIVLRRELKTL